VAKAKPGKPGASQKRYLAYLMKRITDERGEMSHQRFLKLCKEAASWAPSWLTDVVQSSPTEDRLQGVDAWVETTDAGRIPVQIKSSHGSRLLFEEETLRRGIEPEDQPFVIVIRPDRSDDQIRSELIAGAGYVRNLRLKKEQRLIA
jgi:hypothetical protein